MIWWWLACASSPEGIPTNDLASWLETGEYEDWPSEPEVHPSDGPHFGDVRTFLSPDLADSLSDGEDIHPEGAAAVKELFGRGDSVLGHAVMVRVSASDRRNAWHWYEMFEGEQFADGRGVGVCADCHEGGVDFVLTSWP